MGKGRLTLSPLTSKSMFFALDSCAFPLIIRIHRPPFPLQTTFCSDYSWALLRQSNILGAIGKTADEGGGAAYGTDGQFTLFSLIA